MPLFMLISGYLFAFNISGNLKKIILNKFRSLLIPNFTWAIIPLFCFFYISVIKGEISLFSGLKLYLFCSLFSFWFLWAIFWSTLIVLIINKIFNDSIYVYLFIFIISFFITDDYNIALYKFTFPYFVIGYWYKKYNLQLKLYHIYNNYIFLIIIGIIYIVMLYLYKDNYYIYVSRHSIIGKNFINQLYIDIYRYIIGFIGSIFTLLLFLFCYNIDTLKTILNHKCILYVGKCTMGIYIISHLINNYILKTITLHFNQVNYLFILVQSISVILGSILLIKLLKSNPFLNKYFLGAK